LKCSFANEEYSRKQDDARNKRLSKAGDPLERLMSDGGGFRREAQRDQANLI